MDVKVIINPESGKKKHQKKARRILQKLKLDNFIDKCDYYYTKNKSDAYNETLSIQKGSYGLIIVVGGDGTLNEVINGIIQNELDIPVALIPAGTANDFGSFIQTPSGVEEYCSMIKRFNTKMVDLGLANGKYFVNVIAGGLFTDVSYKAPRIAKRFFGMGGYYVTCINSLYNHIFKDNYIEFKCDNGSFTENNLLFLVTNTRRVAGFDGIAPRASIQDGLLDLCAIKKMNAISFLKLFFSLILKKGQHIYHPNFTYVQTRSIEIKSSGHIRSKRALDEVNLDVDGEQAGRLPVAIQCSAAKLRIVCP